MSVADTFDQQQPRKQPQQQPKSEVSENWVELAQLATLEAKGAMIVKAGKKQILLMKTDKGLYACNNRCPHEGYPLKEANLTEGCVLTCNWHNWKFDLASGATLVGGDRLRRYPVEARGDAVWVDVADPPGAERAAAALAALKAALPEIDNRMTYDRLARELSRLRLAGVEPLEGLRAAIGWTHDRFQYGMTHATAAAPDWLRLGEELADDEAEALVPLLETIAHLAWDSLREPAYPFAEGQAPWDPAALVAALEAEDEAAAVAILRGGLAAGLGFEDLRPALAEAALAHYANFGHCAIYLHKTGQLAARLDDGPLEPLLLMLLRDLVYASREDLIPEFRDYHRILPRWQKVAQESAGGKKAPQPEDFRGLSAKAAMERCLDFAADPEALYHSLFWAAAWNLLHFDLSVEQASDNQVSENVGWLDFTHALTFANAVHALCSRQPELWPQGLLQMACFVGRNNAYVDAELDAGPWRVGDPAAFFTEKGRALFDHGQAEPIVSAHLVKLLFAAREEAEATPDAPWLADLLAAVNRLMTSPIKRKHALRAARQSLKFVELEG